MNPSTLDSIRRALVKLYTSRKYYEERINLLNHETAAQTTNLTDVNLQIAEIEADIPNGDVSMALAEFERTYSSSRQT
jgi:uncharacterized coiled-coil protein SlyX